MWYDETMRPVLQWVKQNKVASIVIAVLLLLLAKDYLTQPIAIRTPTISYDNDAFKVASEQSQGSNSFASHPRSDAPPTTNTDKRKVVKNAQLSLLVDNVSQAVQSINNTTQSLGGYMVSSNLTRPTEAPKATVVIRVPVEKLDSALNSFRSMSVRVVSENISGQDVTDEYVDLEERLRILRSNKTRFEEIMVQAKEIDDILGVQEKIFSLQQQIDNLVGHQRYLDQNAKLSKVTLTLASDELMLPYTPDKPWRPQAILKKAVRSLLSNLQKLGTALIWIGVYALVWIPIVFTTLYLYRRSKTPRKKANQS